MPAKKTKARLTNEDRKILISISIDAELIERIDALADEQNRTRSNFVANALRKIAEGERTYAGMA